MQRLVWDNGVIFDSENEYYEVLGFLCKEEEVIKVYIEKNYKAGARGLQGRLRQIKGNCEYFPRVLKGFFINKEDKRVSATSYVRNLRDNHCFKKEIDPTGNDFTIWLYKTSLADVKETVPKEFIPDFERGYLWNYKINTKVLTREVLAKNMNQKDIIEEYASKNRIKARNEAIESKNISKDRYDLFLSHSSLDKKEILSLVDLFIEAGYKVYVDWIEDVELDRNNVTTDTAKTLKNRMMLSYGLAYISTANTVMSKWCPWELGYFDGKKNNKCCILPIMQEGEFKGQEYLGIYPYLRYDKLEDETKDDFFVCDPKTNKQIKLRDWINGQKLA